MPRESQPSRESKVVGINEGKERINTKKEKIKNAIYDVISAMNAEDLNRSREESKYVNNVEIDFGSEKDGWTIDIEASFEDYPEFLKKNFDPEDYLRENIKNEIDRRDDLDIGNSNGIETVNVREVSD